MHASLCICALIPRLVTTSRLVLLVHYREARKPTNTGQLAARCLAGSRVEIVGDRARPLRVPLVDPGEHAVLLYPSDDAVPISELAARGTAITVIVPDGNWRQAAKMGRRIPGLDRIPRVTLGDPRPTEYRLRAEPQACGLATLEAIAQAWRILEGEAGAAVEAAMLHVFRVMVSRTLWLRGALPADQVVGGLPVSTVGRGEQARDARTDQQAEHDDAGAPSDGGLEEYDALVADERARDRGGRDERKPGVKNALRRSPSDRS